MCLILFATHAHPAYPLIVAANRDESYARPADSARFWEDDPRICGGRDLEFGGTWLALSTAGRFAAITNYRQRPRAPRGERSRGELTRAFLQGNENAPVYLRDVERRSDEYTGFSLIVGDMRELWFYSNRGSVPQRIAPGVHGLSNHLLDEPWPKVLRGIRVLKSLLGAGETELVTSLTELLGDRTPAPDHLLPSTGLDPQRERAVSASFIPGETYGTRASTIVLVRADGHVVFREQLFGPGGMPEGCTELKFNLNPAAVLQGEA